jgi:hypothetical protein
MDYYFAAPTTACSKRGCFASCPDWKYKSLRLGRHYSGMPLRSLLLLKHERAYVGLGAAMNRVLSFWSGALSTASIDAFDSFRLLTCVNDKLKETLNKCLRRVASGVFSPAFQRRDQVVTDSRRIATIGIHPNFSRRSATWTLRWTIPALKGRAKFLPTLRVEVT